MRELSYKALLNMEEGTEVIVKDLENDIFDQTCKLCFVRDYVVTGTRGKYKKIEVKGVYLENEEYVFLYDWKGDCLDGIFKVYSRV